MSKQVCIFAFEVITEAFDTNFSNLDRINKICYCYGDKNGSIHKHGAMNLKKCPFLLGNFVQLIASLKVINEVILVSDINSIIFINTFLSKNNLTPLPNVVDIYSYIMALKNINLHHDKYIIHGFRNIFKTYVDVTYHYPKHQVFMTAEETEKETNQNDVLLVKGMSYALEYPLNAIKIINLYEETFPCQKTHQYINDPGQLPQDFMDKFGPQHQKKK